MDIRRDVVRLLRREAVGLILRHVVLHKRRHFGYLVHAGAVAVRIWTPERRDRWRFSCAFRAMAKGALLRVDLASLRGVSIEFRKIDEPASRKWTAGHLILGEPLRVGD